MEPCRLVGGARSSMRMMVFVGRDGVLLSAEIRVFVIGDGELFVSGDGGSVQRTQLQAQF